MNDLELSAAKRFIANTVEALWPAELLTEAERFAISKRVYAFLREEVRRMDPEATVFRLDPPGALSGLHGGNGR